MKHRSREELRAELLFELQRHIGEAKGIHMDALARQLLPLFPGSSHAAISRKLRELILELRQEGYHVCGHPESGYYIAETPEELDRTCLFLYDRAMTSLRQIAALQRISLPDLRGQLKLPT